MFNYLLNLTYNFLNPNKIGFTLSIVYQIMKEHKLKRECKQMPLVSGSGDSEHLTISLSLQAQGHTASGTNGTNLR